MRYLASMLATGSERRLTRLMVPEKLNSGRWPDFNRPRRKIIELPARVISPDPFTLARGVEEFAGERHRHRRPLQNRPGDGEQAIIGKRHEGATVDVARAVEMFLPDPEGAADLAVVFHAVVERPGMGLEVVPGPGAPAGELARCFDVQVGAAVEGGFGDVVQAICLLV